MFLKRQERDSSGKFIKGNGAGKKFKKGNKIALNHWMKTTNHTTAPIDLLVKGSPTTLSELVKGREMISIFGIGDLHYLNESLQNKPQKMINCIPTLKYLAEQPAIDVLIFGGDIWDLDFLSHWNSDSFEDVGYDNIAKLIQQEAEDVTKLLERFIKAARPRVIYFMVGNHEAWLQAFQKKHQKAFKVPLSQLLHFKELGIIEIPQYDALHIGHLTLTHGEQYRGQNPAMLAISRSHRSVFMWHHHKYIVWPGYSDMDEMDKLQAYCLPGMCHAASMDYMKKAPNNWSCGFFKAYMKVSGKFTPNVQVISPNGNFIFNGKEYE
jgi:hypothetical protein